MFYILLIVIVDLWNVNKIPYHIDIDIDILFMFHESTVTINRI